VESAGIFFVGGINKESDFSALGGIKWGLDKVLITICPIHNLLAKKALM
jgi:hypothetical protein